MFEWTVPGRKNHGSSWYMTAGIIVISLATWGILTEIYALAVVIVILAGVYVLLENNAPETISVTITEIGVSVGDLLYDFGQVNDFGIVFDGGIARAIKLRLRSQGFKAVDIPLEENSPIADIRAFLLIYIPEGETGEISMSDRIADRLGL